MIGAPTLRTDVIDAFIFRKRAGDAQRPFEFLQLRRATDPMRRTWQPVMGHVEADERPIDTALREVGEETGLSRDSPAFLALWALEQVWPYYLPESNCIVLSPRFAIEAAAGWEPTLNPEHTHARWIAWPTHADATTREPRPTPDWFLWPGQGHAIAEIARHIADPDAPARPYLRISP